MSFDWNKARAFLATAEEGSLSAAARRLGLAQPTIGRQIAALEHELDVILFDRVGHRFTLTPTGVDLVEHVRVMNDAATRVELTAAGQSLSLEGTVCISASQVTAAFTLPPLLTELRKKHPGIEIEVVATNDTSDLSRREADIAVRSFRPTESDLVARKVSDDSARLYATRGYLKQLQQPLSAETLSKGQFLGFDRGDAFMNGLNAMGLSLTPENFPIITANQLVQWELAKQGAGIAIMMERVGDAEPLVVRALPELPPFVVSTWLTTHRELSTSRRLRLVFDFLYEGLKTLSRPG